MGRVTRNHVRQIVHNWNVCELATTEYQLLIAGRYNYTACEVYIKRLEGGYTMHRTLATGTPNECLTAARSFVIDADRNQKIDNIVSNLALIRPDNTYHLELIGKAIGELQKLRERL